MPEINIFDKARKQISPCQDDSILYIDETAERILHFFFSRRRRPDFGDIRDAFSALGSLDQRVASLTDFDWQDFTKLQMYVLHYSLRYIPRVQLNIIEILNKLINNSDVSIYLYDIGVGPGTTTVAFLTLIKRLYNIHNNCNSGTEFFIKQIHITHSDKNEGALRRSKVIFDHMINYENLDLQIPVTLKTEQVDFDQVDINLWLEKLDNSANVVNIICSFNTLNEIDVEKFNQLATNITQLSISKNTYFFLGEYHSKQIIQNKVQSRTISSIPSENPKSLFNKYHGDRTNRHPGVWSWMIAWPPSAPSAPPAPSDHGPSLVDTLATNLINEITETIVDEIVETISNSEGSDTARTGPPRESRDRSESYLDDSPF